MTIVPAALLASTVLLGGTFEKTGAAKSPGVTVTCQDACVELFDGSVAVHVTVVVVGGKTEPDAWSQLTLAVPLLSVAATE